MSEVALHDRRWGSWWRVTIAIAVLLVVCYAGYMLVLRARVASLVDRIADAGEPVTLDELNAYYTAAPKGEVNAAEEFAKAITLLVHDEGIEARTQIFGSPTPPVDADDEMAAMIALVALNRAALDQAHRAAAAVEHSRWSLDFRGGIGTELPHLDQRRRLARMLQVEARVAAHKKDPQAALRAIHAIFSLAESMRREPLLISQLVRISILALCHQASREVLPQCELDVDQWRRLSHAWQQVKGQEPMVRAMIGERALGHDMFVQFNRFAHAQRTGWGSTPLTAPQLTSSDPWENPLLLWAYRLSGIKQMDHALYLRGMALAVEEAAAADGWKRSGADAVLASAPRWYLLSRLMVAHRSMMFRVQTQINATALVAATVAAAKAYELERGRPPAVPADLVPDYMPTLPMDPFDPTRSLQLTVAADAIVAYSIGADGIDDGGKTVDAKGQELQPGTDIVFQAPRRAEDAMP